MAKKRSVKPKKAVNNVDLLLWLVPIIFVVDRLIKLFAKDGCFSVFCISRVVNEGAAFGILEGQTVLLIIVGIAVLLLIFWIYKDSDREIKLALILIAAGTIANLFDRGYYSGVIDVFSVFGSSSFNLADLSNFAGAVILVKRLVVDAGGLINNGKKNRRR